MTKPGALTAEEMAGLSWLADVGELSRPLAHGFNNFLNTLVLNLAVIEPDIAESMMSDLAQIRRQAAHMASLIKRFQQFGSRPKQGLEAVDLNGVIQAVVDGRRTEITDAANPPTIQVQLTDSLSHVCGSMTEVKRLVGFLLSSALSPLESDGVVTLKTGRKKDHAALTVTDTGAPIPAEYLPHLFELGPIEIIGRSTLELAASESLAKRLGGTIRGENRREGGLAIIVTLPFFRHS